MDEIDQPMQSLSVSKPNTADTSVEQDAVDGTMRYRMDRPRRGKFIIINNEIFEPQTRQKDRLGTDRDAASLALIFKKLGFEVVMKKDQKATQMVQLMIQAAKEDHSDCDCFGVAILTHGADQGILYGVDGIAYVEWMVNPIKYCPSLAGKPKLFFIQACRGNLYDPAMDVLDSCDSCDAVVYEEEKEIKRIPMEADFLYAYSTPPGYFAWRNDRKGSCFIQALHDQLDKHAFTMDLLHILTRVNHQVAFEFESNCPNRPDLHGMKQVPSVVSMMTKDLYFTRKG